MNTQTEVVKAEYFATLKDGEIVTLGEAHPPQELIENQIILSKTEFYFLSSIANKFAWYQAEELIQDIKGKIKANGS